MKPESPRAIRRHSRWRMVQRALRLFRRWDDPKRHATDERGLDVKRRPNDPERLADHLQFCSCRGCGHRRANEGPTMRERRFDSLSAQGVAKEEQ